jgi:hypothetical protein
MIYRSNSGQMLDHYPHRFHVADADELIAFVGDRMVVPLRADPNAGAVTETGVELPVPLYMRHDVDHNLEHAVKFAEWEHTLGWRSTYFILHSAWYWEQAASGDLQALAVMLRQVQTIRDLGHEIGIHTNAVALARDDGEDPGHARAASILHAALEQLRQMTSPDDVIGAAAHGDVRCDTYGVHNNDLWIDQGGECELAEFGLVYEAYFLHRDKHYISDSGGKWSDLLEHHETKMTSMLIHPCHWDIDAIAATS